MQKETHLTDWHEFFAFLLERVVGQRGVLVQANVDVSSNPPEIDILLMLNLEVPTWTPEQLEYLPMEFAKVARATSLSSSSILSRSRCGLLKL